MQWSKSVFMGCPVLPWQSPGQTLAPMASSSSIIGLEVEAVSMLAPGTTATRAGQGTGLNIFVGVMTRQDPVGPAVNPDPVPCSLASRV